MRSNENHLKTAIRTSEWADYVKSLIAPTVVWLIFFALSFIGWMCYCICCCCDKKCPPCGCLRRDAEAHPYKGFELWGLILFIVIFGTGIVGISVAGIIFGTQIQGGVQNTVCTFASMYDDIIYGVTYNETNWIGISNTPEKVNSTIVDLAAYPDKFYNTFGDTKWIDTGINNLLMINRNIYTKYKVSYLSSPNPAYSISVVTSNFLKNVTKIK